MNLDAYAVFWCAMQSTLLAGLGAAALEQELAVKSEEEKRVNAVWLEAIRSCGTDLIENADGTVRVRLTATARFPEYLARAVKVETDAPPVKR